MPGTQTGIRVPDMFHCSEQLFDGQPTRRSGPKSRQEQPDGAGQGRDVDRPGGVHREHRADPGRAARPGDGLRPQAAGPPLWGG